jgi:hypothetical protein
MPPGHGVTGTNRGEAIMIYDKILYRELDELPTLAQGQADDLKIDTRQLSIAVNLPEGVDGINVWCSRVEPGVVEAERYIGGRYESSGVREADDIELAVAAARADGLLS